MPVLKVCSQIKHILALSSRFSLAFENKVAEVDTAQSRLKVFTQRLMFAKRRVETVQGMIMLEAG